MNSQFVWTIELIKMYLIKYFHEPKQWSLPFRLVGVKPKTGYVSVFYWIYGRVYVRDMSDGVVCEWASLMIFFKFLNLNLESCFVKFVSQIDLHLWW